MSKKIRDDFERMVEMLDALNLDYEIPRREDGSLCDDLIYLGGCSVAGSQLLVITFYEDGAIKEFIPYPDSEFHPTNNLELTRGPVLLRGGLMDSEMSGKTED